MFDVAATERINLRMTPAQMRFQPVPPVPDSLPLRVQKDLRELQHCMGREVAARREAQMQRSTRNPDRPLPRLPLQHEFMQQQERAMAHCIAVQQKGKKQAR